MDVPNVPNITQRQSSQRATQGNHSNEMVLYQSPSNQPPQQATQTASAAQPMTSPLTPPAPQAVSASGQQIDWASKIAEVMRDQFGLNPKQQNLMYRTPYPAAYDQLPLPHKYKLPDLHHGTYQ